jgi:hypothetical protein
MAQLIVSWLVSDGSFRVHAINAVGRRKGRILEVEEVDSGERVHGSPPKAGAIGAEAPSVQRRVGPGASLDA